MTFEEFIRTTSLPEMAKIHLPNSISETTKRMLLRCDNAEEILRAAIFEVDRGSKQSLESIIKNRLK